MSILRLLASTMWIFFHIKCFIPLRFSVLIMNTWNYKNDIKIMRYKYKTIKWFRKMKNHNWNWIASGFESFLPLNRAIAIHSISGFVNLFKYFYQTWSFIWEIERKKERGSKLQIILTKLIHAKICILQRERANLNVACKPNCE